VDWRVDFVSDVSDEPKNRKMGDFVERQKMLQKSTGDLSW
jgi:hypothetical protein